MGFWDAYWASLKPSEVEEPIDYWLHRPLGYVLAKLSFPTPITPDAITVGSILLGWSAAGCLVASFPYHLQVGASLIFASTLFDCADGQLARMRRSSSVFGRMLDGSADALVAAAIVPATAYRVWLKHHDPSWLGFTVIVLVILTVVTSGWHTMMYDYYKNVWMRFTTDGYQEGETLVAAQKRHTQTIHTLGFFSRVAFRMYLFHIKSQEDILRWFDSGISLDKIPKKTEQTEANFRIHQTRPWAINRRFFGVGSLMFGLALSNALDLADVYLLFRLVVLNAIFFLILRPSQNRATQAVFRDFAQGT